MPVPRRIAIPAQRPRNMPIPTHPLGAIPPQLPRELDAPEVSQAGRGGGAGRQDAVGQRAEEDVAADAAPAAGQAGGRVPAHAEAQRQRVADDGAVRARVGRDRVGRRAVNDARRDGARRGVQ